MKNLLKSGQMSENGVGVGTVTRGMVKDRAAELAVINGRSPQDVTKTDWDQAKRELTGGPELDPNDSVLDSAPESERWNPVQGSIGHKGFESSSEDEDEDGRSDSARLVQEGVDEAEHDQMLKAAQSGEEP